MSRPALTKADWKRIGAASLRFADDVDTTRFREAVDAIVRARVMKAWEQGYDRGWTDGVKDATQDDGGGYAVRSANPYRKTC